MKKRKRKAGDQANSERAYQLIKRAVLENPGIEANCWSAGCWTALIDSYISSGIDYDCFCLELDEIKKFYRHLWKAQPWSN